MWRHHRHRTSGCLFYRPEPHLFYSTKSGNLQGIQRIIKCKYLDAIFYHSWYSIRSNRWGGVASRIRAERRVGKEVTPMVTFDELLQYTLVLLTVVLTTLALNKRKK